MKAQQAWSEFAATKRDAVVDWRRFELAWKHFAPLHNTTITAVTGEQIEAIAKKVDASKSSVRRDLSCILSFMKWCARKRYITSIPLVERPPESAPRSCWMTPDQITAVMRQVDRWPDWFAHAVKLLFHTGQRLDAVLGLRWEQIDFNAKVIDFNAGLTMAHRRKHRAALPINNSIRAILLSVKRAGPYVIHKDDSFDRYTSPVFRAEWKLLCAEAKIPYITPHGIRHSVGTNLIQKGVPIQEVSHFLGHASIYTTERSYIKRSPEYMKRAGDVMESIVG